MTGHWCCYNDVKFKINPNERVRSVRNTTAMLKFKYESKHKWLVEEVRRHSLYCEDMQIFVHVKFGFILWTAHLLINGKVHRWRFLWTKQKPTIEDDCPASLRRFLFFRSGGPTVENYILVPPSFHVFSIKFSL